MPYKYLLAAKVIEIVAVVAVTVVSALFILVVQSYMSAALNRCVTLSWLRVDQVLRVALWGKLSGKKIPENLKQHLHWFATNLSKTDIHNFVF